MTAESGFFLAANPNVVVVFKMGVEAQIRVCLSTKFGFLCFSAGLSVLPSFMLLQDDALYSVCQ